MSKRNSPGAAVRSCPCGAADYASCCGPLHAGQPATDAGALMRSRYSAYVLKLESYLLGTWLDRTRPATLNMADDVSTQWLGLDVKRFVEIDADHAEVEFVARYKVAGRAHRLHEISRFLREQGRWYYVEAA